MRPAAYSWRTFFSLALPGLLGGLLPAPGRAAEPRVTVERIAPEAASPGFEFRQVPRPARQDAAEKAEFRVLDGRPDPNGRGLSALADGRLPEEDDEPGAAFFFAAGSEGGRIRLDLGREIPVAQVNTYSWHPGERGPQVYTLWAGHGTEADFVAAPATGADLARSGWSKVATVDTRKAGAEPGGQYGVSVAGAEAGADLGRFRYLLFEVARTETSDSFGHTFFAEIDVIERGGPAPEPVPLTVAGEGRRVLEIEDGKYRITFDTHGTPDLTEWVEANLVPMTRAWYPELVRLLASDGYEAPRAVSVVFRPDMDGVAATSGTRVVCAAKWFRENLETEAKGAVFHEFVHVVQQYGRAPRRDGARRPPGWLVEGIADYFRWFRYEPRSGGAWIAASAAGRVRHDASYRVTANFLNWVVNEHGPQVVRQLNAAMREGRYRDALWEELTGQPVAALGEAWKADLARQRPELPGVAGRK